ncbi:restriction endonuclease subunit S (plasmid) [Priestia megaterium]|nr:restriction endonuclease subunit S [Priestia megaterium]
MNHIPEIRFAGFTGEWEQRKFEDVLNKQDGIRRGPFGSALKKEFFVKESDYAVYEQQNAIYDNYKTRYNITKEKFEELKNFQLSEGDFILSGAGTIGRISKVPEGIKQGVFNQALIRFKIDEDITDSEYFIQWIRSENMQRKLTGVNPGSAITNLVPMSEVKKWDVKVPLIDEQTKIGEFFKKLDNTINLYQQELDILKQTKQGFLQKMFPKEGERIPEVRFPGFSEDWKKCKLDKILKERKVKQKISKEVPLLAFAAGQGVIDRSERKTNNRDFLTKDSTKKTYLLTKYDDIVYNPSNLKYGAIDRNKHGQGVISPIYVTFETDEIPSFIELIVKSENFKQRALQYEEGTVTKRQSVKPENLLCLNVVLPSSKDEQMKIGSFFKKIDDTIVLHQLELDVLKETKKAFLQKMFV